MIRKRLTVAFFVLVSAALASTSYACINAESLKKHLADEKATEKHIPILY